MVSKKPFDIEITMYHTYPDIRKLFNSIHVKRHMRIKDYLATLEEPIEKRTLCFLVNGKDEVLIGKKKRGFGAGNYLGIGGKLEQGEEIERAAIREMQEEATITPKNLQKMAVVTFLFPGKPHKWNQEVHVFRTSSWQGEPRETEEIIPVWFKIAEVPYTLMWDDNQYWLPQVLAGKKLRGIFLFNDKLKVEDSEMKPY